MLVICPYVQYHYCYYVIELFITESATIKRKHKDSLGIEPHPQWDNISQSTHSVDSGQSGNCPQFSGQTDTIYLL